jgi:hypothetical protein
MYMKKTFDGKGEDSEASRKILFEAQSPYFAKDRYGVFPRWVTITKGDAQLQTLASLTKKIMGSSTTEKAAVKSTPTPARRGRPVRAAAK